MKKCPALKAVTFTLCFSLIAVAGFSSNLFASASTVYATPTQVDYSASSLMTAENWDILNGTSSYIVYGATNQDVRLNTQIVSPLCPVARISPKIQTGSRITKVSYTVDTACESFQKPLDVIYDYASESSWKGIGLSTSYITNRTNATNSTSNWGSTNGAALTNAGKVWNIDITYTYSDLGAATVVIKAFNVKNSTEYTSKNAVAVTNPCAILSSGSAACTNAANSYGAYSNIKVTYQTPIDTDVVLTNFKNQYPIILAADVNSSNTVAATAAATVAINAYEAITDTVIKPILAGYYADAQASLLKANNMMATTDFLAAYPIGAIADMTVDNAISFAQAANKGLMAYGTLNSSVKAALGDYAVRCRNLLVRSRVLTTLEYADDFSNAENTYAAFTPTVVNLNKTPTITTNNSTESVESGALKITGTSEFAVYQLNSGYHTGLSKISGKFYAASGGSFSVVIANQRAMELSNLVYGTESNGLTPVSSASLLTYSKTRNSSMAASGLDFTGVTTTGATDNSGWLRFEITFDSINMPIVKIFSGSHLIKSYTLPGAYAGAGFDYTSDLTGAVSLSVKGTVYFDDFCTSYGETATASLVKPVMRGATIKVTSEQGAQDLRFAVTYDSTAAVLSGYTPVEYGVIIMTSSKLASHDDLLDMSSLGQGNLDLIFAKASIPVGGTVPSEFNARLQNSGATGDEGTWDSTSLVGKRFSARAYVVYKDAAGKLYYAYSSNESSESSSTALGIANGQASKSIVGVAKSIAAVEINILGVAAQVGSDYTIADIQNIIDPLNTAVTTAEQRSYIFDFVTRNASAASLTNN